jgi:hypothetical protein
MEAFKYDGPGWYMTRGGDKAWVGCDLRDGGYVGNYPLTGSLLKGQMQWGSEGVCLNGPQSFDLIGTKLPEPKRIKGWVNVFRHDVHETEMEAKVAAGDYVRLGGGNLLGRIEIDVEEGTGL